MSTAVHSVPVFLSASPKLCQLPSTTGNTLNIEKYLMQPHFKTWTIHLKSQNVNKEMTQARKSLFTSLYCDRFVNSGAILLHIDYVERRIIHLYLYKKFEMRCNLTKTVTSKIIVIYRNILYSLKKTIGETQYSYVQSFF